MKNIPPNNIEKKRLYYALFFPAIFTIIIILVFLFEHGMDLDFSKYGIVPRETSKLPYILTAPFIHADIGHLLNNAVAFFVLTLSLYYFYSAIANYVLLFSYIFSGLLLWVIGREGTHIGASGIIFSISFFLFFSGVLRKYIPLIAVSLIVVFLYGNNVWHLFPWTTNDPVSWEGHLAGGFVGLILAFVYRNKGPQKEEKIWDDENEEDEPPLEEDAKSDSENKL